MDNANFFHEMMMSDKAKYYCQLAFESSQSELTRLKAKKKFFEIEKKVGDPYHAETLALEKLEGCEMKSQQAKEALRNYYTMTIES